jgi:uncharacterized protein YuzE
MSESYLEVTFRKGKLVAAYFYLPRRPGQKSYRTRRVEPGLIIDFSRAGRPIGIEITAPSKVTLAVLNRVLKELGQAPVARSEIAPLLAA